VVYTWIAFNGLNERYKSSVVRAVCTALGPGFDYSPESKFSREDFLGMDLFAMRTQNWSAEDEIQGRRNSVSYSLLEGKATRTEGSGKHRRTVTIFRGLIVRLDFNKYFRGHTVVIPHGERSAFFGEAGSSGGKDLCRMESVEFEGAFSVYATDQQAARYILTPRMMELVMRMRAELNHDVRISFHDNSAFLALPDSSDRFELKLFGGPVTPDSAAAALVEVIQLAESLIDALDLETRIWTRV
jgi:hypothetical protein